MDSKYFVFFVSLSIGFVLSCEIHPECLCGPIVNGTKERIMSLAGPKIQAQFLNKTVYIPTYIITGTCENATLKFDCTPPSNITGTELVWGLATNQFYSSYITLASPYFTANLICNASSSMSWMYAQNAPVLVASCGYGQP